MRAIDRASYAPLAAELAGARRGGTHHPRELRADEAYRFEPSRFASVNMPTLLLLGGDSPQMFRAAIEAVHRALPTSDVVVMPAQQHAAMNTTTRFVPARRALVSLVLNARASLRRNSHLDPGQRRLHLVERMDWSPSQMRPVRHAASLALVALFVSAGSLGCTSDEEVSPSTDSGSVDSTTDGGSDVQEVDSTIDSTIPETDIADTADSATADTNAADATDSATADTSTTDSADATAADGGTTDTSVADTAVADTADTSTADSATTDTATDTADGAVVDAADAPAWDGATTTESFHATLSGSDETPAVTTTATGSVTCTLTLPINRLACTLTHTASGATSAHLHIGAFGLNDPAKFTFTSAATGTSTTWDLSTSDVSALRDAKMYVNVQTATNPGGELRGTLIVPGETVVLAGRWSPYATGATGQGGIQLISTASGSRYRYYGRVINALGTPNNATFWYKATDSPAAGATLTLVGAAPTTVELLGSIDATFLGPLENYWIVLQTTDTNGALYTL